MKVSWARERVAMLLSAAVLLLPLAAGAGYVVYKHQWAQARLAELEPRYARLLGLHESRANLATAQEQANSLLAQFAYPSTQEVSQAGNDAQQRVRSIFAQAGVEVVSSQVLPAKSDKGFDRIPVSVRLEGEMTALQSALAVLSAQSPPIFVDSFSLQTVGVVKPDAPPKLASQLSLSVLRVR